MTPSNPHPHQLPLEFQLQIKQHDDLASQMSREQLIDHTGMLIRQYYLQRYLFQQTAQAWGKGEATPFTIPTDPNRYNPGTE